MTDHGNRGELAATGNNDKKTWITPAVEELGMMAHTENDLFPGTFDATFGPGTTVS